MTSRISCGFHRIGVVLAVPPIIGSVIYAGYEWNWQADDRATLGVDPSAFILPSDQTGPHVANYTPAAVLLAAALALYAAARAIGWILDGFLSPSR